MNIFRKLENGFKLKFLKKKVLYNFHKYCDEKNGHALMYYKTDPFFSSGLVKKYSHPNNWQAFEIAKILNKLGFWVDIIDRSININELKLKDKYDLFIGIGGGGSGKYYFDITSKLDKAIKIFYASTQEQSIYNSALKKRYDYFSERHPNQKFSQKGIFETDKTKIIDNIDAILSVGNGYAINTFRDYKKPIFRIHPSTSPKIKFNIRDIKKKNQNKFFYFAGSRNILKGLDLLIESFSELPNLELYICTSAREKKFNDFYEKTLLEAKNIHWVGNIDVGGKKFNEITLGSGYVILPSSTEGTATSVTTCMRRGLVPIVTEQAGIDIKDFGYLIKDIRVDSLKNQIKAISKESREDFLERSKKAYLESFKYTQANYSEDLEKALISILTKHEKII